MRASDVMTRRLITVSPEASIVQAASLMLQNRISGLPVVDDDGRLVGLITEGDLLRRAETGTERQRPSWLQLLMSTGRLAEEYVRAHGRKVKEVMSADPSVASENASLEDVVRMMERKDIKRVPVMRDGKLFGIVTRADLVHALVELALAEKVIVTTGDDLIREQVLSELRKQSWYAPGSIGVAVHDGSVELSGTILDERERGALRVLVENVPGVTVIHDHVTWIEPYSGMVFQSPEDQKSPTPQGT